MYLATGSLLQGIGRRRARGKLVNQALCNRPFEACNSHGKGDAQQEKVIKLEKVQFSGNT